MRKIIPALAILAMAGCVEPRRTTKDGGTSSSKDQAGRPPTCGDNCSRCDEYGNCLDCEPGRTVCNGNDIVKCNADGTLGAKTKSCDGDTGEQCVGGVCQSACDGAAAAKSYIGCDYWAVPLVNSQVNPAFNFAIAVANPALVKDVVQSSPAKVTVMRGLQKVADRTVAPGAVEVIQLPWIDELTQNADQNAVTMEKSVLLANGAYHVTSSLPVTVFQFNPLQFEKPATSTCRDQQPIDPSKCHSYTNDASLLIPAPAVGTEYIGISRATFAVAQTGGFGSSIAIPGYLAVVGTQDVTTVTVTYSANIESGTGVTAAKPGQKVTYKLNRGTVLQVLSQRVTQPCAKTSRDANADYCDLGAKYDLTGTKISADKPVAVFGGHVCAFVPYDKWACDHLEEQLFPTDTWGQSVIVSQTKPQVKGEANVWRIVSGTDGNQITFDPAVNKPITLNAGAFYEFVAEGAFKATGTGRTAIAQFMVGQNYTSSDPMVGDPSMGLGIPVEQYRLDYDFLTPTTYTKSYLNIIAPDGVDVVLDSKVVAGKYTAIGKTGYSYLSLELDPGAHHIQSDKKFGITVSGIASFTSYLYPGGLDLNEIPLQ